MSVHMQAGNKTKYWDIRMSQEFIQKRIDIADDIVRHNPGAVWQFQTPTIILPSPGGWATISGSMEHPVFNGHTFSGDSYGYQAQQLRRIWAQCRKRMNL